MLEFSEKRREKVKKKLTMFACILLGVSLLLTACGSGDKVRIGTAGKGGVYYTIGHDLADIYEDDYGMKTEPKETAGSAANLRLISEDYLQLALAQADMVNDAYYATGSFAGQKALKGYSAVAGLYTEVIQIVVLDSSPIQNPSDLAGKTVSVGEEESGTQSNASQILMAYGLSSEMLTKVNMNYQEATAALEKGEIDALFCTAGVQTAIIEKLAESTPVRFLGITDDKAQLLMDTYPFYNRTEIPAGTYEGQSEAIPALGVQSILIASNELSADTVKKITEGLFKHVDELNENAPVELKMTEEESAENITIPFHDGAAAYYEEKGIKVNSKN